MGKRLSEKKLRKRKLIVYAILLGILAVILAPVIIPNAIVVCTTKDQIREISPDEGYSTALVLGAKVHEGGRLSDMLRDRMDVGIALYDAGAVQKLLLSGDGSGEWSEVEYMKRYAVSKGVLEEDILLDGEGYSTYESLSRAQTVYGIDKLVVVTQKYHLYRALYTANDLDMTAAGADAALFTYAGQFVRDVREVLARTKDFAKCLFN